MGAERSIVLPPEGVGGADPGTVISTGKEGRGWGQKPNMIVSNLKPERSGEKRKESNECREWVVRGLGDLEEEKGNP